MAIVGTKKLKMNWGNTMQTKQNFSKSGKNILVSTVAFVAILIANTSMAAITARVGGASITDATNFEDFETYSSSQGKPLVTPSGFTFDCATCDFFVSQYGTGSQALYQNGGSTSMTTIKLTSGADIAAISLVNGNGWSQQDPDNIWVRAYNDGSPIASFQFPSIPLASTITIQSDSGSVFDEVRIQSYRFGETINENESQYGAIAIDDITVGAGAFSSATPVPTMSVWGLVILAGLLASIGFSRRRKI
jgi:hypothetical protein